MLIITPVLKQALKMLEQSEAEFNESQVVRMKYINSARKAGEYFIKIKELLKEATPNNPIATDSGTFTSFTKYLEHHNLCRKTIDNHVVLAENWDIVLKLGMQDESNAANVGNSMRIIRTIKVIRWYKKALKEGRPEEELTIKQYWLDEEARIAANQVKKEEARIDYQQLQVQLHVAYRELDEARATIEELKVEVDRLKSSLLVTV